MLKESTLEGQKLTLAACHRDRSTSKGNTMRNIGSTELLVLIGIIVLIFGGKKLPELARGSGRALRIFKTETQGLADMGEPNLQDERTHPEIK